MIHRLSKSALEVEPAVEAMHNMKTAGIDGIPHELVMYEGTAMVAVLTDMFNVLLLDQLVPTESKRAIIETLFKIEGGKLDCR